jgi:hypothetical protein
MPIRVSWFAKCQRRPVSSFEEGKGDIENSTASRSATKSTRLRYTDFALSKDGALSVRVCYTIPLSSVSRITVNQRKLTICTKKKPKRTDVTMSVWTKHTCTSDCMMRATRTATAHSPRRFPHCPRTARKRLRQKPADSQRSLRVPAWPVCTNRLPQSDRRGTRVSPHVSSESDSIGIHRL